MTATEAQVAAAMEALISEGGSPGNSIHSWRCEYPDRYGPCDCAAETAKEIANAVVAAGPDPAKVALREAADAWQSGDGITVMTPRGVGIPAIDYAQRTLDWLRARIEAL